MIAGSRIVISRLRPDGTRRAHLVGHGESHLLAVSSDPETLVTQAREAVADIVEAGVGQAFATVLHVRSIPVVWEESGRPRARHLRVAAAAAAFALLSTTCPRTPRHLTQDR